MPDLPTFELPSEERRAALLDRITTEGQRRTRRRRQFAGGSVALLVVALAVVALRPSTKQQSVTTDSVGAARSNATTSTIQPAPTTSTVIDSPINAAAVADAPTTTARGAASDVTEPATTGGVTFEPPVSNQPGTTDECINSFNPDCGPLMWQPDPGTNQPLSVTVTASTTQPTAGTDVTLTITAFDPDANISCLSTSFYGWDCFPRPRCEWKTRYGPWTTPAKPLDPQPYVVTEHHTFNTPGSYTVVVDAYTGTGDGCAGNTPWDNEATGTITITVT